MKIPWINNSASFQGEITSFRGLQIGEQAFPAFFLSHSGFFFSPFHNSNRQTAIPPASPPLLRAAQRFDYLPLLMGQD